MGNLSEKQLLSEVEISATDGRGFKIQIINSFLFISSVVQFCLVPAALLGLDKLAEYAVNE